MAIEVVCPAGHKLKVADSQAGKSGRCPVCRAAVTVPAEQPRATASVDIPAAIPVAEPIGRLPAAEPVETATPLIPPERRGYRALPTRVQGVYFLAALLAGISIFSFIPALSHWNLTRPQPGWAAFIWLLGGLQLAFVFWMVLAPDWCTVRVSMLVYAAVAAIYGAGLAMAITTPTLETDQMLFDLGDVRAQTVRWCAAALCMAALGAYLAGSSSFRWRRSLEKMRRFQAR